VFLFAFDLVNGEDVYASLHELEELIKTAGAEVVGRLIQNREKLESGTYLGTGKLEELRDMVYELGATGVCCDDELSPVQMKNIELAIDTKVMDRTMVILDIFAGRATTKEGKIQVELAQLKYRSQRLIGAGLSMSRLGGGIGTRGPGETKLEVDRRVIRSRIAQLSRELEEVKQHRQTMRKQRMEGSEPIVSIVGYTNAGKSTLLNTLTDAGVLEEDKLFATLDPTSRNYKLANGQEIILTDTVGFIRKLPHHLINAFRSTLEEAKYADIILHVVDVSNPHADSHIFTVYETLKGLGIVDKPVVTLFNKIDKLEELPILKDFKADKVINISAKKRIGFDELSDTLADIINNSRTYIEKVISYQDAGLLNKIRQSGNLLCEEYREDGIFVKAYVDKSFSI
ncbi:MAG: GTPase HflX, partial [Lachnospiraceae bacterium]|nr:GTPase HflX [Lachnospiraceae bacterium]